jgi:F-type H+-transporting ATPase subunit delta
MTNRTAATRYARALLDVAFKEADPEGVDRDLRDFVGLTGRYPALGHVLLNVSVPPSRKRSLVVTLAEEAGLASPVVKLLAMLAERDRLVLLPDLTDAYHERLLDRRNVIRAEVTTAAPLPADRVDAIGRRLETVTGRRVSMSTRIDAAIIGGVVARVGSTVYDGSIASHLRRIKQRLVGGEAGPTH